ncbi:uncharacterized protein A1O9_06032 [Exophiala aquamarina CBS 119918]|uniref:Major facilitator superfamily (MFS) profile domain-containing protein n=1 Tax=Exophiala aquamarina CBS 119918 TaxID=1182545 RepID=A0A072PDC1_9EURO|nr:uncharacterized protein A1O9_06032 [Exophiala aquamarina CBS 119918]KEF58109.1 hypothetical protein A1O9_06032 [Exophiala aquamarina CBS 119918]
MLGFEHLALRETFNRRLTLSALLIAVSQFNFGFDQQGFAATQSMDAFDKQFGVWDVKKKTYVLPTVWLSYFNGFNYITFGLGIIIGSWVSKHFGRRMCMFIMSLWAIFSATIVITSKTPDQILAGRILNYIYIGMELSVVPVFQSEITPARARGFIVGTYQLSLTIGGLVINSVARGTGSNNDNSAWRIPFGLFYVVPVIVASLIWFVPESPRWLAIKDRPEAAMKALRELREGKFSEQEINAEYHMILAGIQLQQEKGTFFDMWKGVNLKRSLVVITANFFLQSTGQIFASIYGALFVKSLGTINQFNITIITACINTVVCLVSMALVDKVGRRKLLLVGGTVQSAALMTMGGLGTVNDPSRGIKSGIIAMQVIFVTGYFIGWASIVHTLSAELPSSKLRDLTYRTASVVNVITQFAVSFSLPYLLNAPYANLGSKVGFIFGSMAVLSLVFAYWCVPEVKGRSLEEVDRLFESGTPLRNFATAQVDMGSIIALRKLEEMKSGEVSHVEVQKSQG